MATMQCKVLGIVCAIYLLVVQSPLTYAESQVSALLGIEGYFVKLPSGDIYLFPNASSAPHVPQKQTSGNPDDRAPQRHENMLQPAGAYAKRISRPRSLQDHPRLFRIPPPPPAFGREMPNYFGTELHHRHPLFMPRFDAAKSTRR